MIHELKRDGHSISEIARRLNMDRKTVRKKLAEGLEPSFYTARPPVSSVLDSYKPYLKERLSAYLRLLANGLQPKQLRLTRYSSRSLGANEAELVCIIDA